MEEEKNPCVLFFKKIWALCPSYFKSIYYLVEIGLELFEHRGLASE